MMSNVTFFNAACRFSRDAEVILAFVSVLLVSMSRHVSCTMPVRKRALHLCRDLLEQAASEHARSAWLAHNESVRMLVAPTSILCSDSSLADHVIRRPPNEYNQFKCLMLAHVHSTKCLKCASLFFMRDCLHLKAVHARAHDNP